MIRESLFPSLVFLFPCFLGDEVIEEVLLLR